VESLNFENDFSGALGTSGDLVLSGLAAFGAESSRFARKNACMA
jgi:hypothetical protein